MTIPEAFQIALQHHQAGRLAEAEALYGQILAAQPKHADALHLLGVIAHQAGRHGLAVERIRQAIALNPNSPFAYSNLGEACRARGELDEAMAAYRRAIQIEPAFAEAHNNLGNVFKEKGQFSEARLAYQRALALKPDYPEAHLNLGVAMASQGQLDEAIEEFRHSIALKPDYPDAYNNLGLALRERGRLDEAISTFRRALEMKPEHDEIHLNLGNALRERGQLDEAVTVCRQTLRIKPRSPDAYNSLGNALTDLSQIEEAISAYRSAVQIEPDYMEAHNNLGVALRLQGELDESMASFRRALHLKPDDPDALNNLGNTLEAQGELDEAVAAFRRVLQVKPQHSLAHSNLISTLHYHPEFDARTIREERRRWNRQFGDPLKPFLLAHANDRSPDRPLRIGYVSPDFRDHVVGRNLIPLLRRHDSRNFEILCYSGVVSPDKLTDEFRQRARHWRSTVGVGDEALAEMIRRDGVDILVDLSQHTAGNRLPMFARKPAPVQVSFAGYPESTGLEAIKHRISDRYLEGDPANEGTERREHLHLIDSFWCYDSCGMEIEPNPLPALERGAVTFGCLNNFCKVNGRVLVFWARVLRKVKDSRFVISGPDGSQRKKTVEAFEREGIDAHRVKFVEFCGRREYLKLYHQLDIVLDTFPYNGHTTSLDALWMGLPVVSFAGNTPVSRAGLSQLTNLGLSELVAHSEEEYVRIAVELARDLPRLSQFRSTLRDRMQTSVLMDAPRFARHVEAAFRAMWRRWCVESVAPSGREGSL